MSELSVNLSATEQDATEHWTARHAKPIVFVILTLVAVGIYLAFTIPVSALAPGWAVRAGALYDRVAFAREGVTLATSEPREKESRAYLTLAARFGKVSLEGTEGFELDLEPYQVMYHHDKGFLKLQTTF